MFDQLRGSQLVFKQICGEKPPNWGLRTKTFEDCI